jgi:hypothetical protein
MDILDAGVIGHKSVDRLSPRKPELHATYSGTWRTLSRSEPIVTSPLGPQLLVISTFTILAKLVSINMLINHAPLIGHMRKIDYSGLDANTLTTSYAVRQR